MSDYYVFTDFETTGLKITETDLPIEIGMILTDDDYNILDTLSCYINPFDNTKSGWTDYELQAHKVHTIPFFTIKNEGITPLEVVNKIHQLVDRQKNIDKYNSRFIIMSDNGQFEYNSMQMLYKLADKSDFFPFHYAAWDVNILINSVQKIMKGKVSHKAIQDAFRVYKAVIRALERNGFRKWEK
jgi:oligoribonuclease (3'-5' exoribonuclease)